MVVSYRRICRYLVLLLKAAEKHVTLVVEGSQMFIAELVRAGGCG